MIKLSPLDARIPNWNFNELVERNCPICASVDHNSCFIRPDNLNVRLCKHCNTFFVSPSPSEAQLFSFYSNYDENHGRGSSISLDEIRNKYIKTEPLSDLRIKELKSLTSLTNSKVLDVGFGKAQFLFLLKKLGAIPYGLELDKKSIEIAKALGIDNIYSRVLEDMPKDFRCNVISFNDLIEHPLNPMSLLNTACSFLDRDGFILIWTPNGDIANNEENPTTLRVDLEHMQYLSPDTCIYIASKLNMRIVHLETLGFPALEGIDRPSIKKQNTIKRIKKAIKLIPGISTINSMRSKFKKPTPKGNERLGSYHLFCILQKK